METVTTRERIAAMAYHNFYCDECMRLIGTSFEFEDGYYEELGELELQLYVAPDWYKLKKHLCIKCREDYILKLKKSLESVGFYIET